MNDQDADRRREWETIKSEGNSDGLEYRDTEACQRCDALRIVWSLHGVIGFS